MNQKKMDNTSLLSVTQLLFIHSAQYFYFYRSITFGYNIETYKLDRLIFDLMVLCLHGRNEQGCSEARPAHRNSSDRDMALQIIFKPLKKNSLSHRESCGVFRLRSICDPATFSGVIISQSRVTPDHSANYQSTKQKKIIILCPSFHLVIYNAT